jgi:hypothetical protein
MLSNSINQSFSLFAHATHVNMREREIEREIERERERESERERERERGEEERRGESSLRHPQTMRPRAGAKNTLLPDDDYTFSEEEA